MILASDGVWEFLSSEDVIKEVKSLQSIRNSCLYHGRDLLEIPFFKSFGALFAAVSAAISAILVYSLDFVETFTANKQSWSFQISLLTRRAEKRKTVLSCQNFMK